jgi:hypothetical protein
MSPDLSHDEIRELLGAYALDAVERDEMQEIDQHLTGCLRCRGEVADHRETAAMLANAGASAPDGVWDRIAGSLDQDVIPILAPRPRGRTGWLTGVAAAAALVTVFALGVDVARQRAELERLAGSVEEATLARAANAALLHPDGDRLALSSSDGSVQADAVVLPDGRGYIVSDNLPRLPASRTYQLWSLGGASPISAGVLGPDPSVVAFKVPSGLTGLAISEETAGGATSPRLPPVLEAGLTEA